MQAPWFGYDGPSMSGITRTFPDRRTRQAFRMVFANDLHFTEAHLDDGWAINANDALTTVVAAVESINREDSADPGNVYVTIANQARPVVGAIQEGLTFKAGNTQGQPRVVRLCPLVGDSTRTHAVAVAPGETGDCAVTGG